MLSINEKRSKKIIKNFYMFSQKKKNKKKYNKWHTINAKNAFYFVKIDHYVDTNI